MTDEEIAAAKGVGPVGPSTQMVPVGPSTSQMVAPMPSPVVQAPQGADVGPVGPGGLMTEAAAPVAAPPPAVPPQQTIPMETFAPLGPQTVSTSDQRTEIKSGLKLDPMLTAQQHVAQFEEADAIKRKAEIDAEAAGKIVEAEKERAKQAQQQQLLRENAEEQRRLREAQQLEKVRNAQKEVDESQAPTESVGERLGKGLAMTLGAIGSAYTGGPNAAMQLIENDRNQKQIAWKAQYARMQGKVAGTQNIYAALRQRGLDDQQAEAATLQHLNNGYMTKIAQIKAEYSAPAVHAAADARIAELQQQNLALEQKQQQSAQTQSVTTIDNKSVTKEGGAPTEDRLKLIKAVDENKDIGAWKEKSGALAKFQEMKKSGASGVALADFIAGKGGLQQGSFSENFVKMMQEKGIFGQSLEDLRKKFAGGVDPDLMMAISNGLAAETATALTKAKPVINTFRREFHRAGIDPNVVMGGQTSTETAAGAGFAPDAYQGKQ